MNTTSNSPIAYVSSVTGKVYVKEENGSTRLLKTGDKLYEGDVVIAENGAKAELRADNGVVKSIEGQTMTLSSDQLE